MTLLIVLSLLVLVLLFALRVVESRYGPRPTPDEIHFVAASDGWRLALHRYRPRGDNPHGEPVLLHHGLSGCHSNFDLGVSTPETPAPSLAHWLADRGYDVWVCDLRGRGASERPRLFSSKRWDWSVDDFIEKDNPAFVDYILSRSPYRNLHWIGLSMGGILLFCHCALHGSPRVASGVACGSGLEYKDTGSAFDSLIPLAPLAPRIRRVPVGLLSKLEAPFFGRWNLKMEHFNFYPPNMAPRAIRAIGSGSLDDVSGNVMLQMATMFREGGLTSFDGTVRYAELAANITTPLLLIAGEKDQQSSVKLAEKTRRLLTGDKHKVAAFGRSYGHPEHYGHIDLVAGLRAEMETFPEILAWLRAHPARRGEG